MSTVDNRVVKLTFDNAQFERNIKATQKSVEDFEKSLKFDGAAAGFDKLSKATNDLDMTALGKKAETETNKVANASAEASKSINKIDEAAQNADFSPIGKSANDASIQVTDAMSSINMSGVSDTVNEASNSFNAFSVIATGALLEVGNQITELVSGKLAGLGSLIKKYTIDPISEGFGEYETQIGSIQTIMANTNMDFDSDDDIARVNAALDELNEYADQTIYKFTDMTKAIGTFTAAGLELDDAVAAVKGVSNVAAMSGASMQDVSRVLPQISQALSAGSVTLQDWRSIETANMASAKFVETIGDMAVHMATVNKASAEAAEAGNALVNHEVTMRQALNKVDNKAWANWFSSDILSETLKVFTYDLRSATADEEAIWREHLTELGYVTKEQQDALFKQAEMATRSATEVRTWSQLWDTVGEAIGSNWAGIWRNILGDFKQATATFTFLSQSITSAIDGMLGGIVNAAKVFNKSGAIDAIFGGFELDENLEKIPDEMTGGFKRIKGALDYLVEAVGKPLGAIKEAFDSVFGMDDETLSLTLVSMALAFKDFAQSLVISDNAATALRQIFEGLFSVLDIGIQIVMDLGAVFFGLVDFIRSFTDPLIDIALTVVAQVGKLVSQIHLWFLEVRGAVIYAAQPFMELIGIIGDVISAFFGMVNIPFHIQNIGDSVIGLLDAFWNFIDIPGIIYGIGDAIRSLFGWIGEFTGWNEAAREAEAIFKETGEEVSVLDIWISKLLQNPIISFFKGIADAIAGSLVWLSDAVWGINQLDEEGKHLTLPGIIKSIADNLFGLVKPIVDFGFAVTGSLGGVVGLLFKMFESIGGFASRVGEAILAWEPIKNVIEILNNFKDGAINFFLSLPEKLSNVANGVSGPLNDIDGLFGGVLNWISDVTKYFDGLTVEKFIDDVKNWANGIIGNIRGLFDYLSNTSPKEIFDNFANSMHNGILNAYTTLRGFAQQLDKTFPQLNGVFENGLRTVSNTFHNIVSGVHDFIAPVLAESDSIPDFFVKLFIKIGSSIADGFKNIFNTISNLKPEDVGNFFSGISEFFMNAAANVEAAFPALQGSFTGGLGFIFESIGNFYNDVTKDTNSFGDILLNIFNKIGDSVQHVPEIIGNAFGWLKDRIGEGASWIAEKLRSIPGPVGEFFNSLLDGIEGLKVPIDNAIRWITNLFDTVKNFLFGSKEVEENPVSNIEAAVSGGGDVEISDEGPTDIFSKIKKFFEDKFKSFSDFFFGIPEKLLNLCSNFVEMIQQSGAIDAIIDIVNKVIMGRLLWSLADFVKGMGNLMNVGAKYLKKEKVGSFADTFKTVAIAFGIIAASIWVVSTIPDPWPAVGVMAAMSGLILAMEFVTGLICKHFSPDIGDQLIKSAATIGVFALSLLLAMYTIEKLTAFDIMGNIKGIIAFGVALVVLGGIAALITRIAGDGGKHMIKAAVGVLILTGAIHVLLPAIEKLTQMITSINSDDLPKVAGGLAAIAIFLLAMGGALRLAGNHALGAGIGFILLSVSLGMMADAVSKLSSMPMDSLIAAFAGLAAVLIIFGVIAAKCKFSQLIGAAIAMVAFSTAIMVMATSLSVLANNDLGPIIAAGASLAAFLIIFGVMAKKLDAKTTAKVAASILIFSAAVGVLAFSLYQLAQVDAAALYLSAGAILALLAGLWAMANFTKECDLIATSQAILIFSAAVGVLAFSLYQLAQVDIAAVLSSALAIDAVLAALFILAKFTDSIDILATSIAVGLFAISVLAISEALIALSAVDTAALWNATLAIGALILIFGLLSLFGPELIIAGAAMDLFAISLIGIAYAFEMFQDVIKNMPSFEEFKNAGYNIVAGLGEGILTGIGHIFEVIAQLGQMILGAILSFFGIASPSTLMQEEVGQYIPEGIAEGIMGGEGSIDGAMSGMFDGIMGNIMGSEGGIQGALGGIFDGILQSIGGFFAGLPEWFSTTGLPMLQQLLTDLWTWFTTVGIPAIGQALQDFWNWFTTDGLTMIGEALAAFWEWFTTVGLPAIGEFITGLMAKLGELLSQFWEWFTTQGLPALGEALGQFWNWFTTEGLPALGEFIKGIFEKLGELVGQFFNWLGTDGLRMLAEGLAAFVNWVFTEALPALGQFLLDLLSKIGELPGMLWNWITGTLLPSIGDILKGIIDKLGELGGMLLDWAKGIPGHIAEGISSIGQKLLDIGGDIVRGIKDGILGGVEWIKNAVTDLGQNALDAIKNFFGISSPSKVMRDEVGKYIPAGLAEGISKYSKVAEMAGQQMGQNTIDGVNKSLTGVRYDIPSVNSSITPVMDMSAFNKDFNSYKNAISSGTVNGNVGFNTSFELLTHGFADGVSSFKDDLLTRLSLNDRNMTDKLIDQIDSNNAGMSKLDHRLESIEQNINIIKNNVDLYDGESLRYIYNRLSNIQSLTGVIKEKVQEGQNLYMDTGSLVGSIIPEIDNQLGQRQILSSRGI